ncbi:MAG: GyrI-like domain-containing protein [Thermodesulfobacteriota bacterium]
MTAKLDLKKERKELYSVSKVNPVLVEVPQQKIIAIDGMGDPNSAASYQEAIETLFPIAFKIKFLSKNELAKDYVVMPLEGLWWAEDMGQFSPEDKSGWLWKSFIVQPDFINEALFEKALNEVKKKKKLPALDKIRLETLNEGTGVQILHIGPYSEEAPTIAKLHKFARENHLSFDGQKQKHHEVYLSDVRRVAPEKLKTIIRQPVVRER